MAATRRLAAILAADVAGYSRLMGADEEGTHGSRLILRSCFTRRSLNVGDEWSRTRATACWPGSPASSIGC
jgi:hypothetical protein